MVTKSESEECCTGAMITKDGQEKVKAKVKVK
jgi:hypothetical protein